MVELQCYVKFCDLLMTFEQMSRSTGDIVAQRCSLPLMGNCRHFPAFHTDAGAARIRGG